MNALDPSEANSLVRRFARSDDRHEVADAYLELLEFGQPVISSLAQVVADEGSDLRADAAILLEGFSTTLDSSPALPALWQAVRTGDDWLKVLACGAIWTIDRTEAVVPVLTELLSSPDDRARRLAVMNLGATVRLGGWPYYRR